jgi:hypothetical protein
MAGTMLVASFKTSTQNPSSEAGRNKIPIRSANLRHNAK